MVRDCVFVTPLHIQGYCDRHPTCERKEKESTKTTPLLYDHLLAIHSGNNVVSHAVHYNTYTVFCIYFTTLYRDYDDTQCKLSISLTAPHMLLLTHTGIERRIAVCIVPCATLHMLHAHASLSCFVLLAFLQILCRQELK